MGERCRNPGRPEVCLCPDSARGARQVLASSRINGWLNASLTKAANALAADESVDEERLWRMVFALEDEASRALELWRSYQ